MSNLALDLFSQPEPPTTEGVKYAGSKRKLLPHILSLAAKVKPETVIDAFAGTTRVSQAFAQSGYRVLSNDLAVWSETFGKCYLLNDRDENYFTALIKHLNHVSPIDGWFTENYGGNPEDVRPKKPWQKKNTRKLDAIRSEIDRLNLGPQERAVLITSLILALDEVDSTLGHYVSYLSEWSPRSHKDLCLRLPRLIRRERNHEVHRKDVFDFLTDTTADLAYLDPPYGSNNEKMPPSRVRYSAYYHVWTTICLNDRPQLFGKANRRADTSDSVGSSVFEEFRKSKAGRFIAVESIDRAIRSANADHVILSYSSGGRATAEELNDVIASNGRLIDALEIDHRRNVMSGMRWTNDWIREAEGPNREFLFLFRKK
jgi:adenine-specific DNA-methyltransferase